MLNGSIHRWFIPCRPLLDDVILWQSISAGCARHTAHDDRQCSVSHGSRNQSFIWSKCITNTRRLSIHKICQWKLNVLYIWIRVQISNHGINSKSATYTNSSNHWQPAQSKGKRLSRDSYSVTMDEDQIIKTRCKWAIYRYETSRPTLFPSLPWRVPQTRFLCTLVSRSRGMPRILPPFYKL